MPLSGRFTPVCCATDISAQAKNRFLELNNEYIDPGVMCFVFVDNLDILYTKEDEIDEVTASSETSPFKEKSPEECSELLQQLNRGGSDVNYEQFVIFDDRTIRDDTVLLVEIEVTGPKTAWIVDSVRMASEIVQHQLDVYLEGDESIYTDIVRAQRHEDGVVRDADLHSSLMGEEEEEAERLFDEYLAKKASR